MTNHTKMNKAAQYKVSNGESVYNALTNVAQDFGYTLHKNGEDSDVYEKNGEFVNCWHHSDTIEDGESGFDDQHEWATATN